MTPPGLDPFSDNEVTADCLPGPGGGTRLRLAVNGQVVQERELPGPVLPAGRSGVHGFAYGNVDSAEVPVRFRSFSVRRAG